MYWILQYDIYESFKEKNLQKTHNKATHRLQKEKRFINITLY